VRPTGDIGGPRGGLNCPDSSPLLAGHRAPLTLTVAQQQSPAHQHPWRYFCPFCDTPNTTSTSSDTRVLLFWGTLQKVWAYTPLEKLVLLVLSSKILRLGQLLVQDQWGKKTGLQDQKTGLAVLLVCYNGHEKAPTLQSTAGGVNRESSAAEADFTRFGVPIHSLAVNGE
jgi:hypothetical protein